MTTTLDRPPPPIEESRDGGGHDWVELFRARDDIDAHLLVGRLDELAIETRCVKDRHAPGAWLYGGSNPWAPVTVYVRRYRLVDARMLLAELSLDAVDRAPDPEARSGASPVVWWLSAVMLGLLLTGAAIAQVVRTIEPCSIPVLCDSNE